MRLAEDAGRLHEWRKVAAGLTPQELEELVAYRMLYPWPDDRDDIRGAIHTATVAAAWGGEPDVQKLANYMEDLRDRAADEAVSPEAIAAMMRGVIR